MASLGELFIELGVVGDTKELDKALNTMKETIKAVDKQIQQSQRLRRYREELAKATTKSEKNAIKNEFALEVKKNKLLEQANATQKNIDANKELANNVAGVVKGITAFVGAVGLAVAGLNRLTSQLVESNQAFLNLTRTSDISLNTFQKWDSVGKMLGVQNAAQQIEGLNERLFELMLTGQGARGFQLAGINPMGQDANGVLEQIRNRISGLSDTSASYLLKEMGLDPQMLHLLRMSREEFEALNAEMARYRLTPEQRASIQQMNIQLQIAAQKLQYLRDRAVMAIMPHFINFLNMLAKIGDGIRNVVRWLNNSNSGWAKATKIILGVTAALAGAVVVIKTIPFLITAITVAVRILQGAIMALTAHPIIAGLTLLFGALMLIADDFNHYMNGGGSVIGVIAKGLEELDIQGFLDFPVPKWLEYLIRVIDFFNGNAGRRAEELAEERLIKDIDPDAVRAINPDGSQGGWADIPPGMIMPPSAQNTVINQNRTASTNFNNTINQNNYIETQQPVDTILQYLPFTQRVFG